MWGADATRITRQIGEYGLRGKISLFGVASFTSEELLAVMPPEIEGFLSMYNYCGSLDNPANKRFVDGYRSRYNAVPGSYQYMGYMGAKILIQAIKDVRGNVEDRDAVLAALRKVKLDGPMGPASFDERQRGVFDFYALKVVKKDGRLQNECIDKIAQVMDPYDLFP
jgi:branched-chain amino acid transport system substrate-binding protein